MGGRKGGGRRETSMGGWGEGERKREGEQVMEHCKLYCGNGKRRGSQLKV